MQHPAVLECAVIGTEDGEGLTKTKAFVVVKPGRGGERSRAQGLRQGKARRLQVPALDRVRRRAAEDGDRQDPALSPARARARARRRERAASRSASATARPLPSRSSASRSARRVAASGRRLPARRARLALDVEGLPAPRSARPTASPASSSRATATAARRRSRPTSAGRPTSCTEQAHDVLPRLLAAARHRAALAVRPQRRRVDRAPACRAPSGRRRRRGGAAPVRRGRLDRQHREGAHGLRGRRPAPRPRASHHDDPDSAFRGWNDVWLAPAFRDWNIEASRRRSPARCSPCRASDDEYGTLEQIRCARQARCRKRGCSCSRTAATRRIATSPSC